MCVCVCRCFVLDCKLSRYRPVRARLFVQGFAALCEVCLALLRRYVIVTGLVGFAARRPGRQALRSGGVTSIGTPADGRALPHSQAGVL